MPGAQTTADGTSGGNTVADSGRSSPGSVAVVTGVPLGTSHGPVSVSGVYFDLFNVFSTPVENHLPTITRKVSMLLVV